MKVVLAVVVSLLVACADENPARHLDAGMEPGSFELVVTKDGNGSGTVSSTPAGISCGDTCTASFAEGTMVMLTAEAADDSQFTGWSGACSGDATTCDVTLAAAANVTATFAKKTYTVTFNKAGAGTGGIHGDGVDCTSTCTKTVEHGTMLSLTATPTGLSVFAGWGGACTNATGDCAVTVTSDISITASFALDNFSLIVAPSGNGTGTVTSSPSGISCGATCSHTFTANQMVTLTAAPATSSTFAGWSGGGCSGTGTCTVTIDGSKTVTATFTLKTFALTVTKVGSGTVTSNPAGISCGSTCSHVYNYSTTPVTLSATPASGFAFTGFSGSCTGMTCSVTMTAARNVTATFKPLRTLTVMKIGNGAGTVTGGSISCGSTCTQTAVDGSTITLNAAPSTALSTQSTFFGFSGAGCAANGTPCSVTLDADYTVMANFNLDPNIIFVTKTLTTGDFGGQSKGDELCQTSATAAGLKGTYLAYLSFRTSATTVVNAPERFMNATGWVRPDGKVVMSSIDQLQKGTHAAPPRIMEDKSDVLRSANGEERAWTGTLNDTGTYIDGNTCEPQGSTVSWSTQGASGVWGEATATTSRVIRGDGFGCDRPLHLYCLGIDRKAVVQ